MSDDRSIFELLLEVYTEHGAAMWLASANRNLGYDVPIDLLALGGRHAERVREQVESLTGGYSG